VVTQVTVAAGSAEKTRMGGWADLLEDHKASPKLNGTPTVSLATTQWPITAATADMRGRPWLHAASSAPPKAPAVPLWAPKLSGRPHWRQKKGVRLGETLPSQARQRRHWLRSDTAASPRRSHRPGRRRRLGQHGQVLPLPPKMHLFIIFASLPPT